MNFKEKFSLYIAENQLFSLNDKLLVAVSGGSDSMVLCDFLIKLNFKIELAHCQFGLRGEESENDAIFVQNFAEKNQILCHIRHFDTTAYAKKNALSVQEAARNLRYNWFEAMALENKFDAVVTAHHLNDSIETFFLNLQRGSGLKGLSGIPKKRGVFVRPLICFSKSEILEYTENNKIEFREDSSNFKDVYQRNFIRQHIIPLFQSRNAHFEKTMARTLGHISESEKLLNFFIQEAALKLVQVADNQYFIEKEGLMRYPSSATLLFHLVNAFGFNTEQSVQILEAHDSVGAVFISETHQLLVDRAHFIIRSKTLDTIDERLFEIEESTAFLKISETERLSFQKIDRADFTLSGNSNCAQIDGSQLKFPLKLRNWRQGDRFQPLGLGGFTQKLSDFFSQRKLNSFEKEKIWILENADGRIIWLLGLRLDDRFSIRDTTKEIYVITKTGQEVF
jgi:tRNA(Ile)-lysidine synthase